MGIKLIENHRTLTAPRKFAPFPQLLPFDQLSGRIAWITDQQSAQTPTKNFLFQVGGPNPISGFSIQQNRNCTKSLKNAQQLFVSRVVRNEMTHVDIA